LAEDLHCQREGGKELSLDQGGKRKASNRRRGRKTEGNPSLLKKKRGITSSALTGDVKKKFHLGGERKAKFRGEEEKSGAHHYRD